MSRMSADKNLTRVVIAFIKAIALKLYMSRNVLATIVPHVHHQVEKLLENPCFIIAQIKSHILFT